MLAIGQSIVNVIAALGLGVWVLTIWVIRLAVSRKRQRFVIAASLGLIGGGILAGWSFVGDWRFCVLWGLIPILEYQSAALLRGAATRWEV